MEASVSHCVYSKITSPCYITDIPARRAKVSKLGDSKILPGADKKCAAILDMAAVIAFVIIIS
jgi:hypothetical protein